MANLQTAREAHVNPKNVDETLLDSQETYMNYASMWLWYLADEYQLRAGKLTSHARKAPKIIEKPPLHNPAETHPYSIPDSVAQAIPEEDRGRR